MKTLDLQALAERTTGLLAAVTPGSRITDMRAFPTGASSLTYAATTEGYADPRVVVKVAPPGLAPVRNRDVLRQARLLQILTNEPGIAVPAVLATDVGDPPEVPPLFIMTMVDGDSLEPLHDVDAEPASAADAEARSISAARMLADLQRVDVARAGLGDEPQISLSDEVDRWAKALATVDDDLRAGADDVLERLRRAIPTQLPGSIVHGDWRLGNMLSVGPEVLAVIDWEIWSIGDPRIDLAWMLMMNHRDHPRARTVGAGVPDVERLLSEFEDSRGSRVPDLDWFNALVRYKQAAITALIVKNNRKLETPNADALTLPPIIPILLDWANRILG